MSQETNYSTKPDSLGMDQLENLTTKNVQDSMNNDQALAEESQNHSMQFETVTETE